MRTSIRTRLASMGAATLLALALATTVLPGTALMAAVTRTLFTNPDLSLSMTYDDATMKLQSAHCDNNLATPAGMQIVRNTDNVVLLSFQCQPGPTTFNIPTAQQPTITLTRGKPDGVYFRTF